METIEKVNVEKFKEDIKEAAEQQKFLKDQRKTVHIKGERKMEPWEATMKHEHNRIDLSIMYAALLVSKGWSIDEAAKAHISKKCEDWVFEENKNEIQKLIDKYKEESE